MYNWYNFKPKIIKKEKTPTRIIIGEALVPFLILFLSIVWLI